MELEPELEPEPEPEPEPAREPEPERERERELEPELEWDLEPELERDLERERELERELEREPMNRPGVLLRFASWEQIAQHVYHRNLTETEPPCVYRSYNGGRWSPEQDMALCTCALKDILGVHPID